METWGPRAQRRLSGRPGPLACRPSRDPRQVHTQRQVHTPQPARRPGPRSPACSPGRLPRIPSRCVAAPCRASLTPGLVAVEVAIMDPIEPAVILVRSACSSASPIIQRTRRVELPGIPVVPTGHHPGLPRARHISSTTRAYILLCDRGWSSRIQSWRSLGTLVVSPELQNPHWNPPVIPIQGSHRTKVAGSVETQRRCGLKEGTHDR
jgi:hypothetical protein